MWILKCYRKGVFGFADAETIRYKIKNCKREDISTAAEKAIKRLPYDDDLIEVELVWEESLAKASSRDNMIAELRKLSKT